MVNFMRNDNQPMQNQMDNQGMQNGRPDFSKENKKINNKYKLALLNVSAFKNF